jgi:hypothetical protein
MCGGRKVPRRGLVEQWLLAACGKSRDEGWCRGRCKSGWAGANSTRCLWKPRLAEREDTPHQRAAPSRKLVALRGPRLGTRGHVGVEHVGERKNESVFHKSMAIEGF